MPGRTVLVAPTMSYKDQCACYNEQLDYAEPPPPPYREQDIYRDQQPEYYVLKTIVPGGHPSLSRRPCGGGLKCDQIGTQILGGCLYGTATCLAATLEVIGAFLGGICRAVIGGGASGRRNMNEPYTVKNYEVGTYEYDMVVYRRPRRNCLQKFFDC